MMKHGATQRGLTLVEILVTVAVIAVIAKVALPMLSSNEVQKLNVAAEETASLLRLAVNEAKRTNSYVLVDGRSTAGQLKLYFSTSSAGAPPTAGTSAVMDPSTKSAMVLNLSNGTFSSGVTLIPQFKAGGMSYSQLLIGQGAAQLQVFDGTSVNKGNLEANSGVQLTLGSQTVLVKINQVTGLVTLP